MTGRAVRFGAAAALAGFLLIFFLPVLPYIQPGFGCRGDFPYCIGVIPGFSGYQSIGFYLTGWGAISGGWLADYTPPAIGVMLSVVLPVAAACAWLFAPEMARFSRITRIGLGVFGAGLFCLADLLLVSMLQQAVFPLWVVLIDAFFGVSGVLMVLYTTHTWPLERGRVRICPLWIRVHSGL